MWSLGSRKRWSCTIHLDLIRLVHSWSYGVGRVTIEMDARLVAEGLRLTRSRTKRELVDLALRELVAKKSRKKLLALAGKVGWRGNLATLRKSRV